MAQMLLTGYVQLKKDIKRAMRPHAAGIHSSPSPVRIRSYAPRKFFLIMLRNTCAIIKKFIIESPLNGGTLSNKLRQLTVVTQY